MMLDPVHRVRDNDGLARLQVLQTAGVGVPLCVREILVLAVLGHGFQVVGHGLLVVPVQCLHICPGLVLRDLDESLP